MKSILFKNKLFSLLLIFQLAIFSKSVAQNIAINTTGNAPDTSAMLDITSTTQGLLMPRMTTAQMNAIVLPATGLLVYNTSLNVFEVNIGTSATPNWVPIATNQTGWNTSGNSGTNGATNYLGTTDNHPLKLKVNNTLAGLIDSTGGTNNTFLGLSAGSANTTGTGNVFLGYAAGKSNTTGINNVAIGNSAGGGFNNTGSGNIYIGDNAGSANNNSSFNNIFIGHGAGNSNIATTPNQFIGYGSGFANSTGGGNTFIGYNSGQTNTTGNNNLCLGYSAGTNVWGSNNTLIGYGADLINSSLTNAAAVGYNAHSGTSNSFVIGDTASSANAVKVGIGVRYPLKRLHIDAAPVSNSSANDSLKIDHLASMTSAGNKAVLVIDSTTGYVGRENLTALSVTGQIMRFGVNAQTIATGSETPLRFSNYTTSANMGNAPSAAPNFFNTITGSSITTNVSLSAGIATYNRTTDQVTLPPGVYKIVVRLDLNFAAAAAANSFFLKCFVNNNDYSRLDYTANSTAAGEMQFEDFITIIGTSQTVDFSVLSTTNNATIIDYLSSGFGRSFRSLVLIERLQ